MKRANESYGWTKFSEAKLIEVENKILNVVKTAYRTWFVPVGSAVDKDDKIWTIVLNEESKNVPLVLLHGFAAGLCFWSLNFDAIAKSRPVYAIDLLGFGRSSRPDFSKDSLEAEQQMVESIEEWRKQVNLEKFILLGHSFGGYLATSYAIRYPDKVKHLILADPWGFAERPPKLDVPVRFRVLGLLFYPLTYFNPLATVRAAGPAGPWLIRKVRNDISQKYGALMDDKEIITQYIYHCNAQKPTGETAFHSMRQGFGWAKHPMINRCDKLRDDLPITILFGQQSWITQTPGNVLKEKRPNSYVNIEIIPDAGHHISADQPEIFNEVVTEACRLSDSPEALMNIGLLAGGSKNFEKNNVNDDDQKIPNEIDTVPEEENLDNLQITNQKI